MRRSALLLAFVVTITSLVGLFNPAAYAVVNGTISVSKSKPYAGEEVTFTGNIVDKKAVIVLQRDTSSGWADTRTSTSDDNGDYSFKLGTMSAVRLFRVVNHVTGSKTDAIELKTKKNDIGLVISRDGSSTKIVANGYLSADIEGRPVQLQRAGNGWKNVGPPKAQADNRVTFPLGTYTSDAFRLVALTKDGAPQVVTKGTALTYGPTALGRKVSYVTTRNGGSPRTRGKDYAGTINVDGYVASLETIAVRGNTSATYPKRGYKVKFDDQAKPLGLPTGKIFNLLPNYQDRTLIRTAVSMKVGALMTGMPWTPHRAFTELYINGRYLGAFDLIESVKIDDGTGKSAARIPASPTKGVIIEIDPYGDEDGVPNWRSSAGTKLPFKFKDPDEVKFNDDGSVDPEGIGKGEARAMKRKVDKFEEVLYSRGWKDNKTGWIAYMDLNSAVDWYLTKEFIKDWDGDFYRSNFFYTPDYSNTTPGDPAGKLYMDPIWDVDRSAAAKTSGTSNVTSPNGWWMNGDGGGHLNNSDNVHTTHWFNRIWKDEDFQTALKKRWAAKRGVFKAAGYDDALPGNPKSFAKQAVSELTTTAGENDWRMWAKTGDAKRYQPRTKNWEDEVAFVATWYRARYRWMESRL